MHEFQVLASPLTGIRFEPATLAEEIAQNVRCILTTRRGSVPLDRRFGLNFEVVDKPQPVARAMLQQDIIVALEEYEPRVTVSRIEWRDADKALDGFVCPTVTVAIKKEYADGS